jgi:hypothetical protein
MVNKGENIGADYRGDTVVIHYCGSIGATRYIGNVFQNSERNLMIGTVYIPTVQSTYSVAKLYPFQNSNKNTIYFSYITSPCMVCII